MLLETTIQCACLVVDIFEFAKLKLIPFRCAIPHLVSFILPSLILYCICTFVTGGPAVEMGTWHFMAAAARRDADHRTF